MTEARVLVYDIETAPSRGWIWEKYQTNVLKFDKDWYMLSFAYKWLGTRKITTIALPDYELYDTDPENDLAVVSALWELFDQADVTITHNGKNFDNKKANARFEVHRLGPPSPYKEVDTLRVARRVFGFTSNSLADLCQFLGLPAKGDPGGKETWFRCMAGDPKAWARMRRYNRLDVDLLEQLYMRFRPWISDHPNLAVMSERPNACPKCGSEKGMIARGWNYANVTRRRRYQCKGCWGYTSGRRTETLAGYRSA